MSSSKSDVQPTSNSGNAANLHVSRCPIWRVLFPMLAAINDINELDEMKDIQANNYRLANDPVDYAEFIKGIG